MLKIFTDMLAREKSYRDPEKAALLRAEHKRDRDRKKRGGGLKDESKGDDSDECRRRCSRRDKKPRAGKNRSGSDPKIKEKKKIKSKITCECPKRVTPPYTCDDKCCQYDGECQSSGKENALAETRVATTTTQLQHETEQDGERVYETRERIRERNFRKKMDDTCSCASCVLKKMCRRNDCICYCGAAFLFLFCLFLALVLVCRSVPCLRTKFTMFGPAEELEGDRLKRTIEVPAGMRRDGRGGERARKASYDRLPEHPVPHAAGAVSYGDINLSHESELTRIIDSDKLNEIQGNERLREFYRKLVLTDAKIRKLKKDYLFNPETASGVPYPDRAKRSLDVFKNPFRMFHSKRKKANETINDVNTTAVVDTKENNLKKNKKREPNTEQDNTVTTKDTRTKRYNTNDGGALVIEKKKVSIQFVPNGKLRTFQSSHEPKEINSYGKQVKTPFHENTQRLDELLDRFLDKNTMDVMGEPYSHALIAMKKSKHKNKNNKDQNRPPLKKNKAERNGKGHFEVNFNEAKDEMLENSFRNTNNKVHNQPLPLDDTIKSLDEQIARNKLVGDHYNKKFQQTSTDALHEFMNSHSGADKMTTAKMNKESALKKEHSETSTPNYNLLMSISTVIFKDNDNTTPSTKRDEEYRMKERAPLGRRRRLMQTEMDDDEVSAQQASERDGNRMRRDVETNPNNLINPNWKGPLPLYPDELNSINTPGPVIVTTEENPATDTEILFSDPRNKDKEIEFPRNSNPYRFQARDAADNEDSEYLTDVDYIEDYLQDKYESVAEMTQAYSDNGVLKDIKNKNERVDQRYRNTNNVKGNDGGFSIDKVPPNSRFGGIFKSLKKHIMFNGAPRPEATTVSSEPIESKGDTDTIFETTKSVVPYGKNTPKLEKTLENPFNEDIFETTKCQVKNIPKVDKSLENPSNADSLRTTKSQILDVKNILKAEKPLQTPFMDDTFETTRSEVQDVEIILKDDKPLKNPFNDDILRTTKSQILVVKNILKAKKPLQTPFMDDTFETPKNEVLDVKNTPKVEKPLQNPFMDDAFETTGSEALDVTIIAKVDKPLKNPFNDDVFEPLKSQVLDVKNIPKFEKLLKTFMDDIFESPKSELLDVKTKLKDEKPHKNPFMVDIFETTKSQMLTTVSSEPIESKGDIDTIFETPKSVVPDGKNTPNLEKTLENPFNEDIFDTTKSQVKNIPKVDKSLENPSNADSLRTTKSQILDVKNILKAEKPLQTPFMDYTFETTRSEVQDVEIILKDDKPLKNPFNDDILRTTKSQILDVKNILKAEKPLQTPFMDDTFETTRSEVQDVEIILKDDKPLKNPFNDDILRTTKSQILDVKNILKAEKPLQTPFMDDTFETPKNEVLDVKNTPKVEKPLQYPFMDDAFETTGSEALDVTIIAKVDKPLKNPFNDDVFEPLKSQVLDVKNIPKFEKILKTFMDDIFESPKSELLDVKTKLKDEKPHKNPFMVDIFETTKSQMLTTVSSEPIESKGDIDTIFDTPKSVVPDGKNTPNLEKTLENPFNEDIFDTTKSQVKNIPKVDKSLENPSNADSLRTTKSQILDVKNILKAEKPLQTPFMDYTFETTRSEVQDVEIILKDDKPLKNPFNDDILRTTKSEVLDVKNTPKVDKPLQTPFMDDAFETTGSEALDVTIIAKVDKPLKNPFNDDVFEPLKSHVLDVKNIPKFEKPLKTFMDDIFESPKSELLDMKTILKDENLHKNPFMDDIFETTKSQVRGVKNILKVEKPFDTLYKDDIFETIKSELLEVKNILKEEKPIENPFVDDIFETTKSQVSPHVNNNIPKVEKPLETPSMEDIFETTKSQVLGVKNILKVEKPFDTLYKDDIFETIKSELLEVKNILKEEKPIENPFVDDIFETTKSQVSPHVNNNIPKVEKPLETLFMDDNFETTKSQVLAVKDILKVEKPINNIFEYRNFKKRSLKSVDYYQSDDQSDAIESLMNFRGIFNGLQKKFSSRLGSAQDYAIRVASDYVHDGIYKRDVDSVDVDVAIDGIVDDNITDNITKSINITDIYNITEAVKLVANATDNSTAQTIETGVKMIRDVDNDTGITLSDFFMKLANWFSMLDTLDLSVNKSQQANFSSTSNKTNEKAKDQPKFEASFPLYDADMIENIGHRSRVLLALNETVSDNTPDAKVKGVVDITDAGVVKTEIENTTTSNLETFGTGPKVNKSKNIVKRNADGNLFWDHIYNDEDGADAENIDINDARKNMKSFTRRSAGNRFPKDWFKNIVSKVREGAAKLNSRRGSNDEDEHYKSAKFNEGKPRKVPKPKPTLESYSTEGPKRFYRKADADFLEEKRTDFAALTAKMKKICQKAASDISLSKKLEVREDNKEGQVASRLMQQLIGLMSDLVDYQVQEKTCRKLPMDLQQFLEWLTSSEATVMTYHGQAAPPPSKPLDDVQSLEALPPGEGEGAEPKADYMSAMAAVRNLLAQYESLSDDDKSKMTGVKEYLEAQMEYLQKQLYMNNEFSMFNAGGSRFRRDAQDSARNHSSKAKRPGCSVYVTFKKYMKNRNKDGKNVTKTVTSSDSASTTNKVITIAVGIGEKTPERMKPVKSKSDGVKKIAKRNLRDVYYRALQEAKSVADASVTAKLTTSPTP